MAVKARNRKKLESEDRMNKAMKIKCCYCDAKTDCKWRARKEESETKGIVTYCTLAPNISKQKKKQPEQRNFFEAMLSNEDKKSKRTKYKNNTNKTM